MKMFLAENWQDRLEKIEVLNPFDGKIVDTVPKASLRDVEIALTSASQGTLPIRRLSGCWMTTRAISPPGAITFLSG